MAQCVTDPTLTLYGTTVVTGADPTTVYSTTTRYATSASTDVELVTSTCDGGYKGGLTNDPGACSHYSTYTTTISGTPSYLTYTDIFTSTIGGGQPLTSTFPTATQYTTICTESKANQETSSVAEPGSKTSPNSVTSPTPPPAVVVVPSSAYSVGVSSKPVSVTDAQGRVSISVQVVSVSAMVSSNVAVQSGINTLASAPSSTPIGPIIGGVVGGLAFIGAIIALVLIRKKRGRSRYDDDYDEGYGTVRRSRSIDRGEKVERKRMDLAEDEAPGVVQPFTYSDATSSAPTTSYQPHYPATHAAYAPVPSASPGFSPTSAYPSSSQSHSPPPPAMTPAQAKAMEAHRSQSAHVGSSSAGGPSYPSAPPQMEQDEVVVHQDAGPARVELPPVYADRT